MNLLNQVIAGFNQCFLEEYRTRLCGGFDEPFYQAPSDTRPGEIQFRSDYIRSSLHEVAHWCVAGNERRQLDDFGYWYEPDGRNQEQQLKFYQVEVRPQAYEWIFCDALQIEFDVSLDNLGGELTGQEEAFKQKVLEYKTSLLSTQLPKRVKQFKELLEEIKLLEG